MIILGIIIIIITIFLKDKKTIKKEDSPNSICFLIPARDESKVIENLLVSILNQTITVFPKDIYVIVESKEDPTISICKKYDIATIIRKNLDLKTKGYALDEGIKSINKKYDMYFIIDADNVLDSKFVEEMIESYKDGYDIATGYRNTKNGNDSLISAASSLTFSFLNNLLNKNKVKKGTTMTFSGTGFYIKGSILNKFEGYPFHSLTEDYELTLYSSLNELSTTYNEKAIFYDEQPVKYKNTINQRKRWIKGYFLNRYHYLPMIKKAYHKSKSGAQLEQIIGIKPYLMIVIGLLFWFIYFIMKQEWLFLILSILSIYLILVILTSIILKKNKNINLSKTRKKQMLWFHPIYLCSYVLIALSVLLNPKVEWERVEHNSNINIV